MNRSYQHSDKPPLKLVVAAGQREVSNVGKKPSRSLGAHRQANNLHQERRPSPEMEGSPSLPRAARTPSSSGSSVDATRQGPPRLKLTACTNASTPHVSKRTPTSRTSSESSGITKDSSPKARRRPSSGARIVSTLPTATTQQQSCDVHGVSTVAQGKFRPHREALRTPQQRSLKYKRSDEPRKMEWITLTGVTAANPRPAHAPKQEQPSLHPMQASECTYPITTKVSSSQVVATSRTRQHSEPQSLSRSHYDAESQPPRTTAFPPQNTRLRKKHKVDTSKEMGDAACYGAWKNEIQEPTTTTTRAPADKSFRPDGVSNGDVSKTAFLKDPSGDSSRLESRLGARPGSSPTRRILNFVTPRQPAEFAGNSTISSTSGLEELRRRSDALPDERTLEVTVDIPKRHHVPDAARSSAVSSADRSSFSSIVKRILATIMIHPSNVRSMKEEEPRPTVDSVQPKPSRASKIQLIAHLQQGKHFETKLPYKPKETRELQEDVEYGSPVNYECFLPNSEVAMYYFELPQSPDSRHKSSAKPSTAEPMTPEESKEPEIDIEHGSPVDYERFVSHSGEALCYTELPENLINPQKLSPNPSYHQLIWGTQGVRRVSPPAGRFSYPKSMSPASTTGHPSIAKPIGPSKRETTAPPTGKPTPTTATQPLSKTVHDASESLNKPTTPTKQVDKQTEKTPIQVYVPSDVQADSSTKTPSHLSSALTPSKKGISETHPGPKKPIAVRPLVAAFQRTGRQQEHDERNLYDVSLTAPSTAKSPDKHLSKKAIPAEQTAASSPEVKTGPVRALNMKGHDESRGEEKKLAPAQTGPLALSKNVSKTHSPLPSQQRGPGTRPFKAFVHNTLLGGTASATGTNLIITVKDSSARSPEAGQKTPTTRTFVTNVRQTVERLEAKPLARDQRPGQSQAPASKEDTLLLAPKDIPGHTPHLAKEEGKGCATLQKDTDKPSEAPARKPSELPQPAPVAMPNSVLPTRMRLLKMSTLDKGFREMMLWDYGPIQPRKTPFLHDKDRPPPRITVTIPQKAAPLQPTTPAPQMTKQAAPALDKAAVPQPAVPTLNPTKQPTSETQKAATPQPAPPTAKPSETLAKATVMAVPLATATTTKVSEEAVPSPSKAAAPQLAQPASKLPQETLNDPANLQGTKASADISKAALLQPTKAAAQEPAAKVPQEETAAPDKAGELKLVTTTTKMTKDTIVSPTKAALATEKADKVPECKDSFGKPHEESGASKQRPETKPDAGVSAAEAAKLRADAPGTNKNTELPAKAPVGKCAASKEQLQVATGKDASPEVAKPTHSAALLPVKTAATDPETGIKGLKSPAEKTQLITTPTTDTKSPESLESPAEKTRSITTPTTHTKSAEGLISPAQKTLSITTPTTDTKSPETKPALGAATNVPVEKKSTLSPNIESKASPVTKLHTAEIVSHETVTGKKHKAHTYKCAKHTNETEAEYRVRKDKAKAKARLRAIAIATAQDIFDEEEHVSFVRRPLKKKKKRRKSPPPEKEATDQSGKEGKKGRIVVRSERHTKTGTCPCCIIILIILLILIALLYLFWPSPVEDTTTSISTSQLPPTNQTSHPPVLGTYYCSSDVCNAEAKYLKSLLSTNKKPCDNFYEYVCEGWIRAHAVPGVGAGGVLSSDTILQDSLANDIEPVLLGMQDKDVKIAAGLHEDCMKRDKVGKDGDTVINVARQIFRDWAIKEWPVLKHGTVTTEVAWTFAGELVRDLSVAALTSVSVGVNPKVLEAAAIELDKPRLVFSCNDASRAAVTNLFKDALKEVMSRFAAASAAINSEVDNVMSVFVRLASSPALAVSPDTTPLSYTNVQLIELDTGYKHFLEGVFNNIVKVDNTTEVVLKSPDYLRNHLKAAMQELPPHAVVNYLGFMALVKAAPFFPEKFSSFRQIFGKDVLDRTLPDVSQTKALCLLAVQQVLPGCFAKAAANLRAMHHIGLPLAEWLSRLETAFGRHQERVAWIGELSALIVRYRLGRNRMASLSSGGTFSPEPCAPSPSEIQRRSEHPLRFFHQVSMLQEQKRLQMVLKTGQQVLALRDDERSELATVPEYDVMRQAVHVPMALFNTSVPSSTTMFSLHLSRVAVRLYRAMVQVLFPNNIYERDAPLALTGDMARRLDKLLSCFEEDLSKLPADIRGPVSIDSAKFRGALLQHAAAVRLAFRAFEDLHSVRRIWNVDFRFKDLPDFSSNALFFLYYALDNCESADPVYEEHHGPWMPAHYRVNAALRHDPNFASEFGCTGQSPMAAKKACDVLKNSH